MIRSRKNRLICGLVAIILFGANPVFASSLLSVAESSYYAELENYLSAKANYDKAVADLENYKLDPCVTQEDVDKAKEEVEAARVRVQEASAHYVDAKNDVTAKEKLLNNRNEDVEDSQKSLDEATTKQSEAQKVVDEKIEALHEAEAQIPLPESAVKEAETRLAEAQAAFDVAEAKYLDGSFGFFEWMLELPGLNETNKKIIYYALKYLDEDADFIKRGVITDATSLRNMKASLQFIREGNEWLKENGGVEKKVNSYLMAIAQANLDWNVYVGGFEHRPKHGAMGECLAWTCNSPIKAWLSEKPIYDKYGGDLTAIEKDGYEVGHYLLFKNWSLNQTGIAVYPKYGGTVETDAISAIQEFDPNTPGMPTEDMYTIDEYEAFFDEYVESTGYFQSKETLEDAKNNLETVKRGAEPVKYAQAELDEANAALAVCKTETESAEATLEAAKQAVVDAEAALETAKEESTRAKNAIDEAQKNLSDCNNEATFLERRLQAQPAIEEADKSQLSVLITYYKEIFDKKTETYDAVKESYVNVLTENGITDTEAYVNPDKKRQVASISVKDMSIGDVPEVTADAVGAYTVRYKKAGELVWINTPDSTGTWTAQLLASDTEEYNAAVAECVFTVKDSGSQPDNPVVTPPPSDITPTPTVSAKYNINDASAGGISPVVYTGEPLTPAAGTLFHAESRKFLCEGKDYIASYENNINPGTATLLLTGMGDFGGTKTLTFVIKKREQTVTVYAEDITLGEAPKLNVTAEGNYTVAYNDGTGWKEVPDKEGYWTVKVTAEETDYSNAGSAICSFRVNEAVSPTTIPENPTPVITETPTPPPASPTPETPSPTTTPSGPEPTITPTITPTNPGVTPATGEETDISFANIEEIGNAVYTGEEIRPVLHISCNGQVLTEGIDYRTEYINNEYPGTASVIVYGIGQYTNERTVPFYIEKKKQDVSLSVADTEIGSVPGITATAEGDYTISYVDAAGQTHAFPDATGQWMAVLTAKETAYAKAASVTDTFTVYAKEQKSESVPKKQQEQKESAVSNAGKMVVASRSDEGPKGTKYAILQLHQKKATKNSITIAWKKTKAPYIVYGALCGKRFKKLIETRKTSFVQKKLKAGKYYKYIVVDATGNISKTVHIATSGGKYGNCKKLALNKKTLTLKKTFRLAVKQTGTYKKHRAIKWESSNPSIVSVKNGKVKAKKKGKAVVYAYAQNGVSAKCKIIVK